MTEAFSAFTIFFFFGLPVVAVVAGAVWIVARMIGDGEFSAAKIANGEVARDVRRIVGSQADYFQRQGVGEESGASGPAPVPVEVPEQATKAYEEAARCLSSSEPAENADQLRAVASAEAVEEMIAAAEAAISEATRDAGGEFRPALKALQLTFAPVTINDGGSAVDYRMGFAVKVGEGPEAEMFKVYRDYVVRVRPQGEKVCRTCGAPIRKRETGCEYCGTAQELGDWRLMTAIPTQRSASPVVSQPKNQAGMLVVRNTKWGTLQFTNVPTGGR